MKTYQIIDRDGENAGLIETPDGYPLPRLWDKWKVFVEQASEDEESDFYDSMYDDVEEFVTWCNQYHWDKGEVSRLFVADELS